MTGATDLIGREAEVAVLRSAIDEVRDGTAQLIVVTGEAGIGKSRLVQEVERSAQVEGFAVFRGESEALAGEDAFGSLVAGMGIDVQSEGSVAESTPSLLSATASQARARFVDRVTNAVRRYATSEPTLLVLEDAHRLGATAVAALRSILRACELLPLLVVMSMRPPPTEEAAAALQLLVDVGARLLELGPLSADAIAVLALAMLGGHPGPHLARLLAGAGGNPLYAIELMRGLAEDTLNTVVDGVADTTADALPASLHACVMREVAGASLDARGVLRLGAMLGTRFSLANLAAVAGRTPAELALPAEELVRAQLLADDGDRLRFRHELVREVIYSQMPAAVRRGVHRQIADALAAAGAAATHVAVHISLSAEPGDLDAAAWLRRAARETIGHDPAAAADYLGSASAIAAPASALRASLLSEQLDALMLCGRLNDADRVSADLVHELREPEQIADARRRRGMVLLLRNRPIEAADVLEGVGGSSSLTLAEAAFAALAGADADRARRTAARACELARSAGDLVAEALGLCILARLETFEFRLEQSLTLTRQAVAVADSDLSGEAHRYQPLVFEAITLHELDRLDDVIAVTDTARRIALEQGMGFAAPLHDGITAFAHLRAGRLHQAIEMSRAGIAAGDASGMTLAAPWCNALLALASLHTDDIDTAQQAVIAGHRALSDGPPLLGYDLLVLADALVHEELGEADAAIDLLMTNWLLLEALPAHPMAAVLASDLVRLAVAADRKADIEPVVRALEAAAAAVPLASWQGAALEARARLDGDIDTAMAAVAAYRSSPRRMRLAEACETAASLLESAGRAPDARPLLEEAAGIYELVAARRDRSRVLAAGRAAGGRVRRRQERGGEPGTLSGAEREVARLVAAGLTNPDIAARLFISPRTVETHLQRIFAKLEISSRVELAVWATEGESLGD